MTRSIVAALAGTIVIAAPASAQEPKLYAVHPLVVIGDDSASPADLQKALERTLTSAQVATVPTAEVTAFIQKQPEGRCESTECLAALARETKADLALRVSVAPRAQHDGKPHVIVSGKVIQANGIETVSLVRQYQRTSQEKGIVEAALDRFVRVDLALGSAEVEALIPDLPPEPTVITEVKVVEASRPAWIIPTAAGSAAVAVAGLGIGGWLQLSASRNWADINAEERQSVTLAEEQNLQALRAEAETQQSQATVAFIAGGAFAAASGILFLYSSLAPAKVPDAPAPVTVSAFPLREGFLFGVSGSF